MSTPRPTEADVETAARAMHERQEYTTYWDDEQRAGTRMRELGEQGRGFYRGLATVALSAVSTARAAEHQREVEALRRWKAEASSLFDGLQDLGRALGLPLGELITGPAAVEAASALTARAEAAERVLVDRNAAIRAVLAGWDEAPSILSGADEWTKGWLRCLEQAATEIRALLPTEDYQQ